VPDRPEAPRSLAAGSPTTSDEGLDASAGPEDRRRPTAASVAVLTVLAAALLWLVVTDEGAPSVGAPSPEPTFASPTPHVPEDVDQTTVEAGPEVSVAPGRHAINVEGVPLSFDIPADGWHRKGALYLSKSPGGSGEAEALLYWTVVSGGTYARECGQWWGSPPGSTLQYVRSATRRPGEIEVSQPAKHTRIGGVAGSTATFRVTKEKAACQPGFLYRWRTPSANSSWTGIEVGDVVQIWVVDVGGTRLVIEADTHADAPSRLAAELQQIVASVRFEPETG
jgi:hypothetical protein